jgi:hypothetical protein
MIMMDVRRGGSSDVPMSVSFPVALLWPAGCALFDISQEYV